MKDKILMVLRTLFGLMMINAGLNKFFHYMPMPEMPDGAVSLMMAMMDSGYMFPLIAITEIAAGVLLIPKKYSALGAVLMMPVTVNILFFHIALENTGLPVALVMMAINIWVLIDNKAKFDSLLK